MLVGHSFLSYHYTNLMFVRLSVCDWRSPEVDLTLPVGWLSQSFSIDIGMAIVESAWTTIASDVRFREHTEQG